MNIALLPILMLMIPQTQPLPSPRLATPHIFPQHNSFLTALPHARSAESPLAAHAQVVADARLEHLPTAFARFGAAVVRRPPGFEQVAAHAFGDGTL